MSSGYSQPTFNLPSCLSYHPEHSRTSGSELFFAQQHLRNMAISNCNCGSFLLIRLGEWLQKKMASDHFPASLTHTQMENTHNTPSHWRITLLDESYHNIILYLFHFFRSKYNAQLLQLACCSAVIFESTPLSRLFYCLH